MVSFGMTRRSAIGAGFASFAATRKAAATDVTRSDVSCDPTRELYREINTAFLAVRQRQTGDHLTINQSHGGSGAQSRAVPEGLQADVVSLALAAEIDVLARHGRLAEDWQKRLPDDAGPYTGTIGFPVRKGNPKRIHDWGDLIRPGVSVITPNPTTTGGARWNFLAALGWAERRPGATTAAAEADRRDLFHHASVPDTGARGATNSFLRRAPGDVPVARENEAWLARKEFGADRFAVISPSLSIPAEPPVAVADSVADRKRYPGRGHRLSAVAHHEARPDDHRQTLPPPAQPSGGGAVRRTLSVIADDRHPGFRRLGCGTDEIRRRRRYGRPHLGPRSMTPRKHLRNNQARIMSPQIDAEGPGLAAATTQRGSVCTIGSAIFGRDCSIGQLRMSSSRRQCPTRLQSRNSPDGWTTGSPLPWCCPSHRTKRVANATRWLITGGPLCNSIPLPRGRM